MMLDDALLAQLKTVFTALERPVTLAWATSGHARQPELVALVRQLAETSPLIQTRELDTPSELPYLRLERDEMATGVEFLGVPGGHEFTSLVLAILHADGKGKWPDAGVLARVRRLKGEHALRTFISLECENCPEVVQALNLFALANPRLRHTMVDGGLAQEEVARLGILGVPSVMLGDRLVSSGKASLADLVQRLESALGVEGAPAEEQDLGDFDVVVVGAGPAGASAAIYAARKGLKTAVIAERVGGQVQDTKGIENLISVPYTEGPKLAAELATHMREYDIRLLDHRRVRAVGDGPLREILLESGERLRTRALVVATGAKWRELGISGEKEYLGRGVAFCPHCDGPSFKGRPIAVVGGGNSGVEAAIDLAGITAHVTLFEFAPALKADQVLVNKLTSLPNVTVVTNARTSRIMGDGAQVVGIEWEDRGTGAIQTRDLAGVFVQIGLSPNSGFVRELVATNSMGEIVVDEKCRTNVKGVYAAGDVTTVPYKQIVISMGEGAKAGLAVFEDLVLA
jgi:alkyl hydroperoxide reductase subunit F